MGEEEEFCVCWNSEYKNEKWDGEKERLRQRGSKRRERRPVLRALAVWYGLGYFAAEALKEGGVATRTYPRHSNGSSIGRF